MDMFPLHVQEQQARVALQQCEVVAGSVQYSAAVHYWECSTDEEHD